MPAAGKTPATAQMDRPRLLALWGSETQTAKHGITKLCKQWSETKGGAKFTVDAVMSGDEAAKKGLSWIREQYEVLLVATSSYGQGEAPGHFQLFLNELIKARKEELRPFEGMQHAVLGFGDTIYIETFQNCPRIADKFLGELGSRRFVQRAEIDASGDVIEGTNTNPEYKRWGDEVFAALQKGLPAAKTEPVCDWTVPADGIVTEGVIDSVGGSLLNVGMALVAIAVGLGCYYFKAQLFGTTEAAAQ